MARECSVCGKKRITGNTVSHANNKSRRVFQPNLQKVRVIVNTAAKRMMVCTRCLRSNRVQKAL